MQRLKEYRARLILFPRKVGQAKAGDAPAAAISGADFARSAQAAIPLPAAPAVTEVAKADMPAPIAGGAYRKLRDARSEKRNAGRKAKREKEQAEEAAAAKK